MPTHVTPPPSGNYNVICPHCEEQFITQLVSTNNDIVCNKCQKPFLVYLATVRAKRGRTKTSGEYIIRAVTKKGEEVLRFKVYKSHQRDMDLRSRDLFLISYKEKLEEPGIICNLTTKLYINVGKAREEYQKLLKDIRAGAQKRKQKESSCFIVTATCGRNSWEASTLTAFRDKFLAINKLGRFFIKIYYQISPSIAFSIRGKNRTTKLIRTFFVFPISKLISKIPF